LLVLGFKVIFSVLLEVAQPAFGAIYQAYDYTENNYLKT